MEIQGHEMITGFKPVLCPRYSGSVFLELGIKESLGWLQKAIREYGFKPHKQCG